VATWNTHGLRSGQRVAQIYQDLLDNNVHLALIQETNLHPQDPTRRTDHLPLPGNCVLATPSTGVTRTNRGKGVAIIAHPILSSSSLGQSTPVLHTVAETVNESFELLAVSVANIIAVTVYVHAATAPDYPGLHTAIAAIPNFWTSNVVVGGDFNHPHRRTTLEREVMAPLGLTPTHDTTCPTPTRGQSALDLIFWKGTDISVSSAGVVQGSTSDHCLVLADVAGTDIASLVAPCPHPPRIVKWDSLRPPNTNSDSSDLDFALFNEKLDTIRSDILDGLPAASCASDPLTAVSQLCLHVAADRLGTKECRLQDRVPWWNRGLTRILRQKRRAYANLHKPNISTRRQRRYQSLHTQLSARFTKACHQARCRAIASLQAKFRHTDINRAWITTQYHRGKRHPRYTHRVAPSPDLAVEHWRTVFLDSIYARPTRVAPDPTAPDLFSDEDVTSALRHMEDHSPGPDGLRIGFLKTVCNNDVAALIATALNNACRNTVSPRAKSSLTVLIKKPGGNALNPTDYRPIALQPVTTKLLSKCIEAQIWKQVDEGTVHLSDSQGGFRPHRSRFDLVFLLRCAQDHYKSRRNRSSLTSPSVYSAFLDITKAYDSAPHTKILESLRNIGVKEPLVRVISDLLADRTTTIYGRTIDIGKGVPQGDPLSPLLFIIVMQPLSEALAAYSGGGVTLPGGLLLKDLLYADDIALLAESPEELTAMLNVCEEWATSVGLQFSIKKSKLLLLVGNQTPANLPTICMYGEALEWVDCFTYLGFPIYARGHSPGYLPLDLSLVNSVMYPMASVVHPQSIANLHLFHRAQVLANMVEGKAMHNAPMADMDCQRIDTYINKHLRAMAGLWSQTNTTFLRCEFGVLPASLVVDRNALYFLWHLRRETWFRQYLPYLAHLQPFQRLTSILLKYPSLRLPMLDTCECPEWHQLVKNAVLLRATSFYDTTACQQYCLSPQPTYTFAYLGQKYMTNPSIMHLASTTIQLRYQQLPTDVRPWLAHPCPYCSIRESFCGAHLLQCHRLPPTLAETRAALIASHHPGLSLSEFAARTIACTGAETRPDIPELACQLPFLAASLSFGRTISNAARAALRLFLQDQPPQTTPSPESDTGSDLNLTELFTVDVA